MSRPIEQIEWELAVARAMYIDAMMWIGELRQEGEIRKAELVWPAHLEAIWLRRR